MRRKKVQEPLLETKKLRNLAPTASKAQTEFTKSSRLDLRRKPPD